MPCEQPACPSYRAGIKNHGACASWFQQMLARPLRHNFHAGQNVRVKAQPVLARADVIHFELFRAGQHGQNGKHQNKQLLHCVLLKMGMKKPRCVCIVVECLGVIRAVHPVFSECRNIRAQPAEKVGCFRQAQYNLQAHHTAGQSGAL